MNISLAITTFNRLEFTIESFAQVLNDDRINDIIILDDCSTDGSFEKLVKHFEGVEKVRVIQQARNRGMSLNKRDAIALSKNEWVIIFDSDNVIGKDYLDALEKCYDLFAYPIIFCPDFAKPQFDYRKFSGKLISQVGVSSVIKDSMGNCLFNTCNYVVNRDQYLKIYSHNPAHYASDTIWFNYLWLKSLNSFYVVPGMQYMHRVHDGSGFKQDIEYNMQQAGLVRKMIMAL